MKQAAELTGAIFERYWKAPILQNARQSENRL